MSTVRWTVPEEDAGQRLDRHVALHLGWPRNQVQNWIREGRVWLDGEVVKASAAVELGDTIECSPPPRPPSKLQPESGELTSLYCDAEVAVIDKPAGLVVHPGAGQQSATLVHRLLFHYPEIAGVGGVARPGIVHRLDQGTSGALVVARTEHAYQALSLAFAERRVTKIYLAVVYGRPSDSGVWDQPIGRHAIERVRMTVRSDGRPSRTGYRVLATAGRLEVSLLGLRLLTGRTHQIRVHAKAAGHPLIGDPLYGEARWKAARPELRRVMRDFGRPALHAWYLGFPRPATGDQMLFRAPPPADLEALWLNLSGENLPESAELAGFPA